MQRFFTYTSLLLIFLLFSSPGLTSQESDFVLVININNPVNEISALDAKRIFLGKKTTWENNQTIILIINSTELLYRQFARRIVNKNPSQFSTYWKKQLFSGRGIIPQSCKSDKEVKDKIAADKNTLGYISKNSLDDTVKQLTIR